MLVSRHRLLSPFLLVLLAGIVTACGTTQPQVLAPEYERGAYRGVSVALLPLASELVPTPSAPAQEEQSLQATYFTREGHKLFYRLFVLDLQEVAAAEVFDLGPSFRPDGMTLRPEALPLPSGDSLQAHVPDAPVDLAERPADFLLLIDKLRFTPRSETVRSGAYGSANQQDNLYIVGTCQYVLWDNREGRVAAYGTFENESRTVDPSSRAPYEALFEKLALHIIGNSPIALTPRFQSSATPAS